MAARELSARERRVPVLLYHGLTRSQAATPEQERKYWLEASQFAAHLRQIQKAGCKAARLRDLWGGAKAGPAVAITFDDGLASDYELAFPALAAGGASADFFVNTSRVGQPGSLTWAQMVEMQRAGMAFQSHSHEHVALSRLSRRALAEQLGTSRKILEDRLGSRVEFLAAPYGFVNRGVIETALEQGYRGVCTSLPWPARPGRRVIPRVGMHAHTTAQDLERILAGDLFWFVARAGRAAALYLPKQILLRFDPAMLGVRVLETGA